MTLHPDLQELEDLADDDRLSPHLATCAECAARLERLRAEGRAIRAAAGAYAGPTAPVLAALQRELFPSPVRRLRGRAVAALAVALAASSGVALFLARSRTFAVDAERAPPGATAALDVAERDYLHAIAVLEKEVDAREGRLPAPIASRRRAARSRARAAVSRTHAREQGARLRQLEGYAAYLRSLRRSLEDSGGAP